MTFVVCVAKTRIKTNVLFALLQTVFSWPSSKDDVLSIYTLLKVMQWMVHLNLVEWAQAVPY
jgi:hypothetical protein